MIQNIRHIGLVVFDLEKSLRFWCEVLGFKIVRQMQEFGPHIDAMMTLKNVELTTVKLKASDGSVIELLKFHSHSSESQWNGQPYSTGFTHIALTVDDMDLLIPRLIAADVTFPNEPQISPDGCVKAIYVRGPEGVLLELVQVMDKQN